MCQLFAWESYLVPLENQKGSWPDIKTSCTWECCIWECCICKSTYGVHTWAYWASYFVFHSLKILFCSFDFRSFYDRHYIEVQISLTGDETVRVKASYDGYACMV